MSNLISDILKLGAVAGICVLGYYLYENHMEAKHRRSEERRATDLDRQNKDREETAKKEAEQKAKDEKRAQLKAEQEAAMKAEREARARRQEETRQAKLEEEALAKSREQVAKQAAKEEAEENRQKQVADAQDRLAAVRKEKYLLQARKEELTRTLVATNNRLDGARKTAEEAEAKARNYAASGGSRSTGDMSGTSAVPLVQNPAPETATVATIQGGDRGINSSRTDNSELIAKERARADSARREMLQMQVVAGKAQMELITIDKRLREVTGEESTLEKTLRDCGEDPSKITWKGVAQPPAEYTGDNRILLKDGTVLHAEKVVDFGKQYSIKTTDGKFVAVDKDKIESIPEGLLPKK